jgi:hypothetical protein
MAAPGCDESRGENRKRLDMSFSVRVARRCPYGEGQDRPRVAKTEISDGSRLDSPGLFRFAWFGRSHSRRL